MNAFTSFRDFNASSAFAWLGSPIDAPTDDHIDLSGRWDALHTMAREVGAMGQLAAEPMEIGGAQFNALAEKLNGNRQTLLHYGLSDIELILKQGLDALKRVQNDGGDVTAQAVSMWCEFHRARQAILKLVQA